MQKKLRIAWFSPINLGGTKSPSISAYVSDELLPALSSSLDIEIFHDGFDSYPGFQTHNYLRAFECHRQNPYDIFFYQVEDGPASHFTRFHLGLIPGVVLFHDLIFVDSGAVPLYVSPWRKTIAKFNDDSKPWPLQGEKFEHAGPFGYREASLSGVPVFSTERNHIEYKRNVGSKIDSGLSYYLPYPVANVGCATNSQNDKITRIGYCGSPRIENRAHKMLLALSNLKKATQLVWLIEERERNEVLALLSEFKIENAEIISGRSPQRWCDVSSTLDVAIHTLFSAYGQPGPYLPISLMRSVPSIVTNFGSAEFLPEKLLFKVQPGEHEASQIEQILNALTDSVREECGRKVREYASEQYDTKVVAAELRQIFERAAPELKKLNLRWDELLSSAKADVFAQAEQLVGFDSWNRIVKPCCKELGW